MKLTDKQKHDFIISQGFDWENGFVFDICKDDDTEKVFVSQDEVDKKQKEGAKTYYILKEYGEMWLDFESAFEEALDTYACEKDLPFDNEELEDYIFKKEGYIR